MTTDHNKTQVSSLWRHLTSSAFLFSALAAAVGCWGGSALIRWWSPTSSVALEPWLVLGAWVLVLWTHRFTRVALVLGALLLIVVQPGGSWNAGLFELFRLAGFESIGGLLFFALLARLLERCALVLGTPTPPLPLTEGADLHSFPVADADAQTEQISQFLTQHIGPVATRSSDVLWAERGRNAALGQIWLLLGGLLGLLGALVMLRWPGSLTWTKVFLGTTPWLLIGGLLQTGPKHAAVACWREKGQWHLWLHSPLPSFTLAELQPLLHDPQRPEADEPEADDRVEQAEENTEAEGPDDADDSKASEEPEEAEQSSEAEDDGSLEGLDRKGANFSTQDFQEVLAEKGLDAQDAQDLLDEGLILDDGNHSLSRKELEAAADALLEKRAQLDEAFDAAFAMLHEKGYDFSKGDFREAMALHDLDDPQAFSMVAAGLNAKEKSLTRKVLERAAQMMAGSPQDEGDE